MADDHQIDYYRDNALQRREDDEFKHMHYVEVLKSMLYKSETPISIGLYGKWGVGKSSIIQMLGTEVRADDDLRNFKYIEIDAWSISKGSLQQGILEAVNTKLDMPINPSKLEDKLYNVQYVNVVAVAEWFKHAWKSRSWGKVGVFVAGFGVTITAIIKLIEIFQPNLMDAILSIVGLGAVGYIASALTRLFFNTSKKAVPKAVSAVHFNKIYNEIIEKQEKVVVVIDNLDRCDATVAVELLGIMQTFMVKPNCINIVACDDDAIISHLKNVKSVSTHREGNEFLSKFFQVVVRIPPFMGENMSGYVEKLIEKRKHVVKFDPYVKAILISDVIKNPRKINHFLNIAVALYHLARLKEEADIIQPGAITGQTDFLVKMVVIKHEWPEFYRALESNPDLLTDGNKRKNMFYPTVEKTSVDETDLEKFLDSTDRAIAPDITPFLWLTRESYMAESRIAEFEDVFVKSDEQKIADIFAALDDDSQNKYMIKIDRIINKHKNDPKRSILANCTLSMFYILPHIHTQNRRTEALSILAGCLEKTTDHWQKFDVDKLGLFRVLEEMDGSKSKPFYDRLVLETFPESELNEALLSKMSENWGVINERVREQIDKKLQEYVARTDLQINEAHVTSWINNRSLDLKDMTTHSHVVSHVTSLMNFDGTSNAQVAGKIYETVKDSLSHKERIGVDRQLVKLAEHHVESNTPPPAALLEFIKTRKIGESEENVRHMCGVFSSLCRFVKSNPNRRSDGVLGVLPTMFDGIRRVSEKDADVSVVEDALSEYAKHSDPDMLQILCKTMLKSRQLDDNDSIIHHVVSRYVELDVDIAPVMEFLLTRRLDLSEYMIDPDVRHGRGGKRPV